MRKKATITLVALLLLLSVGVVYGLHVRNRLRAKTTETRMKMLMGVLDSEQPRRLDTASLKEVVARYNRSEVLTDGWGQDLVVEQDQGGYRITSLGRDGRRGSCCTARVHGQWDEDAVLSGQSWLQVW
jgi:hypothetical protein